MCSDFKVTPGAWRGCSTIWAWLALALALALGETLKHLSPHRQKIDGSARISIVTLTHNDLERTRRCLSTLLEVLPDALFEELLILDNASSDGTREYVLSLAAVEKVRVLTSDSNLGVALGRQRLFAEARSAIIASLDSDVAIRGAEYFYRARGLLAANPAIGICGASGYLVHFFGDRLGLIPYEREGSVDCVSGFCQIFPRRLLQYVHLDEAFSPFWCEDTDFCFQAKAKGYRIYRLDPAQRLEHNYRSLVTRCQDPRKAKHEGMLVRKWARRVKLLGEPRWRRIQRRTQQMKSALNASFACYHNRARVLLRRLRLPL
jgi:GT2 family glycosyltransferase